MVKYAFESLSESNFEAMTVDICQTLFGVGVHAFAAGRDGGRDSYFEGVAERYPSSISPWSGRIIIQAKHTTTIGASCSDNDFFVNQSSVLHKEVCRIKEIKKSEHIDGYLVVTNRKLTGGTHIQIKDMLSRELGISQVDILGIEDLSRSVEDDCDLIKKYRLTRFQMPDVFYEKDIQEVIVLFRKNTKWTESSPPDNEDFGMKYIGKEEKNRLNNVDAVYFSEIKAHSLKHFAGIDKFLRDPINSMYLEYYLNTVADLRGYIVRHQQLYSFIEMLETIIVNIVGEDATSDIFKSRALVRVFVHYMYWNCDLGRIE